MDANSTPTAPAPTTIKVFGISGSSRIERLVRIVLWSGSIPGSDFASDPLTIRMLEASICVFFPSFSTLTRPGPSYLPQPCTHSTLFFLNRNSMPFACFLTILSLRASTLAQLIFSPLTSNPNFAEVYDHFKNPPELGFEVSGLKINWANVLARKDKIDKKNAKGIEFLFNKN